MAIRLNTPKFTFFAPFTRPAPTTAPTTAPSEPEDTEPTTQPTQPGHPSGVPAYPTLISWEEFMAMTGAEQYAYYKSFPSVAAYQQWYNNAKKTWEDAQPKETVGPDGSIVLPK